MVFNYNYLRWHSFSWCSVSKYPYRQVHGGSEILLYISGVLQVVQTTTEESIEVLLQSRHL